MKFTGEFFIPYDADKENVDNPELEIEHKQRYLSILKMVEGKTVLDIASGEGYGTFILSSGATQAIGVDINPDLVEHAGSKYKKENLRYLQGSAAQIPLESNSIDILISFETLEHIDADTQKQFLTEVKRVLKADGALIVSTPNKQNYTDRYNHQNKFHLHELNKDEFEGLLKEHFGHVRLYDQGLEVTSVILNREDYTSQKPIGIVPIKNNYHFEGKYQIGLCSDLAATIQTSIASIVPESEKSYFQLIDRILDLQREVEELGAWGTRSAAELQTLEQERPSLIANLAKLQDDLAESNHKAFLLEAELEALQQFQEQEPSQSSGMKEFTKQITQLNEALSGKIARPTRYSSPPKSRTPAAETSTTEHLKQQIDNLQKDLLWYRKTYEERSLLGLIKQKIAARIRK